MNVERHEGQRRRGRGRETLLWAVAILLMVSAAGYQRRTGPSHPVRGDYEVGGQSYRYSLIRNHVTSHDARATVPDPRSGTSGSLYYKRYRSNDEFTAVPLRPEGDELVGDLPAQPPAGKLEYFLVLRTSDRAFRVPDASRGGVVIRFKDEVPLYFLISHISTIFLAMLVAVRAGLAALFSPVPMRRLVWVALALITVGGMILGPIVQKYAFGAFWTGFPFGYDLTDNKVLIMWLVWIGACLVVGLRPRRNEWLPRTAVIIAAFLVVVVYLIPHSAQGSELDYRLLEEGVPASEAIKTGQPSE